MTRLRLACTVLLAGFVATACTTEPEPPPETVVERGVVTQGVSASGSLVSITEQNLGFADGGQVVELMVNVGDTVAPGQPLARLDDATAQSELAAAQAALDQQQASLGRVTGANTVASAEAALASAESILDATREQVDAADAANATAVDRAHVQLDYDRDQLADAREQLNEAKKACPDGAPGGAEGGPDLDAGSGADPGTRPGASAEAEGRPTGRSGLLGSGSTSTSTIPEASNAPRNDVACEAVATAEQAVATARGQVIASETALSQAEGALDTEAASGRVSVANAEQAVTDAGSQLDGANNDAPADVAEQDAIVADALNTLADAERGVENTLLRAPVAGTVSTINGAVGDFIPAAGGATALAPGTDARIPGVVGTGAAPAAGGADAAAAGGAFITLNDVDSYQLVVPFEESDAAQVAPNQPVEVSVDAIPDLSVSGTVVAVAPTADQISDVVSYYTTIVLNETDPRLRDGQTAEADVRSQVREGVLRVPNTTVRQENGRSVVDVPDEDGEPLTREFTPGLVGTQFTEVASGLDEGQQVLLPHATVEATPQGPN